MSLANLLGLLVLVVGVPLNLYVARRLRGLAKANPDAWVLHERARLAVIVLIVVVVFGLIFVNNDTLPPPLSGDVTKLITRAALLILAIVPAVSWLWRYRKS